MDDEPAFLYPMKKMIQMDDVNVDTADTVEKALDLLTGSSYDAVIADVRLGGTLNAEGLTILEFIKARNTDTKVLIMTGYGGPDIMQRSYNGGADYYFEKPVSIKVLSHALSALGVL